MIRGVTFDFWGTLYIDGPVQHPREQLRVRYAADFFLGHGANVSESQLRYAYALVFHEIERFRNERHMGLTAEDIGRRLAEIVNVRLGPEDAERLGELISSAGREMPPQPLPGTRELLAALHGRARLGLICDTGLTLGHDLYAVMEADGLARWFDGFTFSNQTGTTKPEVRQYHHTLLNLDCPPEQAVHVGDTERTDVAGAKAAGMRAILIAAPGTDPATTPAAPTAADATVECLADVLAVLKSWGLPRKA